jgi:DnaJ-class molecular chaperone
VKNSSNNQNTNNPTANGQKTICKVCNGKGYFTCNQCQGTGVGNCQVCGGDGKTEKTMVNAITKKTYTLLITCSKCGGDGKITCPGGQEDCNNGKVTCISCHGDGNFEPENGDSYTI